MNQLNFRIRVNENISSFVFSFGGKELLWGSYRYGNYRLRNNYGPENSKNKEYSEKYSKAKRIIKRLEGIG